MYICYLISNKANKTYIGSTNNFKRRLRQHNCEIAGGAKYTTSFKGLYGWSPIMTISGLDKHTALSLEWRMKRRRNTQSKLKPVSGVNNRILNLFEIIEEDYITSKSCRISDIQKLEILIDKSYYIDNMVYIFDVLESKKNIKIDFN